MKECKSDELMCSPRPGRRAPALGSRPLGACASAELAPRAADAVARDEAQLRAVLQEHVARALGGRDAVAVCAAAPEQRARQRPPREAPGTAAAAGCRGLGRAHRS